MHLVPDPLQHDDDGEFEMTPRQMWVAHLAACTLADGAYDDIAKYGDAPIGHGADWSVFVSFPPATWREGAQLRRQAARAFDDLAGDIDAGH
ncbi:hypothetical protein AB0L63_24460 [Nocardia sp. NPDC051990]|uniref:hypothetical protein n=1 Tax=Nocardia sp. NPDC051990 TaxID=3155285 RepID=UPI003446B12F